MLFKSPPKQYPSLPVVPESEIEESFIRGQGPGGQKINKTSVVAQLKHLPTGIVVQCQATRSQSENRRIGRRLLREKLDGLINGDQSRAAQKGKEILRKKKSAQKKRNRKYASSTPSETDGEEETSELAEMKSQSEK